MATQKKLLDSLRIILLAVKGSITNDNRNREINFKKMDAG